ncbi:MAG: nucleotide exchange factor GrpE [Pseudomonadota bacterium]
MSHSTDNIEEIITGKKEDKSMDSENKSNESLDTTDSNPSADLNEESGLESNEAFDPAFTTTESSSQLMQHLIVEQRKTAELQERLVRQQAEMQNVRRRAERDIENAHKYALDRHITDLLPVLDGLERGLDAIPESDESQRAAREGIVITQKMLTDVLTKSGIEIVDPQGEIFNPQHHEAMSMISVPDTAPNTVVQVLQRGYSLNGRLLRPAMVIVSKV